MHIHKNSVKVKKVTEKITHVSHELESESEVELVLTARMTRGQQLRFVRSLQMGEALGLIVGFPQFEMDPVAEPELQISEASPIGQFLRTVDVDDFTGQSE